MALTSSASTKTSVLRQELVLCILLAIVCGGLAGAAAGFFTGTIRIIETPISIPSHHTTSTAVIPVAPTTTFALVPVASRPASALVPSAFLTRRSSSVASIYRKPKGTALEDRVLNTDHLLGQGVALTSDGWFVTVASVLDGMHLADLTIWHDGVSYPVTKAVIDHLTNTAYLKTDAAGLSSTAFAHAGELAAGQEVWTEVRSNQLAPAVTVDLRGRLTPNEAASSESAVRRIVLNGASAVGDIGSAAWDPNGSLIGLIESGGGEQVRLIPASGIAASFSSLLSSGQVQHALLGVRAIDLADLRLDGSRGDLPASGAWIHDDKKTAKLGVTHDGPAAKAKLQTGDVILRIEHDILDGAADLGEVLAEYRPGTAVTLRIVRGTTDMDVPVVLGSVVTSENLK